MAAEIPTAQQLLERIEREGLSRTITAFRKPPLPSRLLQELLDLPDCPAARQFVAAYPLSPGQLLEVLATTETAPVLLRLLAGNPRMPPHLLAQLASHEDAGVREEVATHPKLPARELLILSRDTDSRVRVALSSNSSLRLPDQAQLADDDEASVRLALAHHSALSPQAAVVLASDSSAVVRIHTVATAHVEMDVLLGWAASEEEELQLALLLRGELSMPLLSLLMVSPHASVRRQVRARLKPDKVELYFLASRGDLEERCWVASQKQLSRALQSLLARDLSPEVRIALATNSSLQGDIGAYFVSLGDEACCEALAANPAVSDSMIQELAATRLPSVLRALAYRQNLEPVLVTALVSLSPEFRRHWAFVGGTVSGLDAVTARALLSDPLPRVRALGVSGHLWRRADLYDLARDASPLVRMAVLHHVNVPEELLSDYTKDAAPEVAALALQRLVEQRKQRQSLRDFATSFSAEAAARASSAQTASAALPASSAPHPSTEAFETGSWSAARSSSAACPVDAGSVDDEALSSDDPSPPSLSDPSLLNKLKRIFFWQ